MNLGEEILREHSKRNTLRVATLVNNDPDLFRELIGLTLSQKTDLARKASWVLRWHFEEYPETYRSCLPKLISQLRKKGIHHAVKRNILGILKNSSIPSRWDGELIDICFRFIESASETIAVKAFSMEIITKIGKREPLIMNELKLILEDLLPYSNGGIESKIKKILSINPTKIKTHESGS